jgi:hypothetical protein
MKTRALLAILLAGGITAMVACGSHATSSDPTNASGSTSGGTSQSAAKASGAGAPSKGFGPMRTVEIWDPMFNMVAYTLSIPQNWNFEGTVLHGPGCSSPMGSVVYRAYSPDMQYGVQVIPTSQFLWSNDERGRPKAPGCKILQPMSAEDYGRLILPTIRPGAVVDSVEIAADDAAWRAAFAKNNQLLAQQAAAAGNRNPATTKAEARALFLHYDLNGRPEEEALHIAMTVSDTPTLVLTPFRPGQKVPSAMEYVRVSDSTPIVSASRAPKGQLMAHAGGFAAIGKSFKENPDYLAKYAAFMQDQTNKFVAGVQEIGKESIARSWAVENSILKLGQQEQAQRMASSQAFIANMQKQGDARNAAFAQHEADRSAGVAGFNAQEDARSGHARDVSDYLLDQQLYVNPTTGQTQTQSNQYDHTYSNGSGPGSVVVQANGPNTNPQGVITGNWTELQPIHH